MKDGKQKMPLIKEYRVDMIRECLRCLDEHPFERDRQKECILSLYPNKEDKSLEHREKSIFRGMVIPSLRSLGLIVGYGDYIRSSANGRLIVESKSMGDEIHQRVLRTVVLEIDKNWFKLVEVLLQKVTVSVQDAINLLDVDNHLPERQRRERVKKWCSVLEQVGLIIDDGGQISIESSNYKETLLDTDTRQKSSEVFRQSLFNTYYALGVETAGIVNITDLRLEVAIAALKTTGVILTEGQFDEMLRNINFATDDYIVSLGRPMGAEEKLFKYRGEYFRTLSIKSFRR